MNKQEIGIKGVRKNLYKCFIELDTISNDVIKMKNSVEFRNFGKQVYSEEKIVNSLTLNAEIAKIQGIRKLMKEFLHNSENIDQIQEQINNLDKNLHSKPITR